MRFASSTTSGEVSAAVVMQARASLTHVCSDLFFA